MQVPWSISNAYTAYCDVCKPASGANHVLICSHNELERIKVFVQRYLPPPLEYVYPTCQQEWLSLLANNIPYVADIPSVCEVHQEAPFYYSSQALAHAIDSVIMYYKQCDLDLPSEYDSSEKVMTYLLHPDPQIPLRHPMFQPYALPGNGNMFNDLMLQLRHGEGTMASSRYSNDQCSTTLVLFSPRGWTTPFHFDWTEAKNVALGVQVRCSCVAQLACLLDSSTLMKQIAL